MNKQKKLALGTVQFGMNYGVANATGQVTLEEARAISELALSSGVNLFDTAPAYGNSEYVLGKIISSDALIVTKTASLAGACIEKKDILHAEDVFQASLKHLAIDRVYGLLVHSFEDLQKDGGDALYAWLKEKKQQGLVEKIGVSVYTADDIDKILKNYVVDIIQLPVNVLDQRLISSGHLAKLKEHGVEIHARSVFLQGLLLMEPTSIPSYFDAYRNDIEKFYQYLHELRLTPLQLSLGFVSNIAEIDRVIIGVNTASQLSQVIDAASTDISTDDCREISSNDLNLINPSNWVT